MLREKFIDKLKEYMHAKEEVGTATVRLIIAALKDRDIAARSKGNHDGLSEDEILSMLQTMIKQRGESIKMYRDGNRDELADREEKEVVIIKAFLPEQLETDEIENVIGSLMTEINATSIKDMGKVMKILRDKYAGRMDFGAASGIVKQKLTG